MFESLLCFCVKLGVPELAHLNVTISGTTVVGSGPSVFFPGFIELSEIK